MKKVFAFAILGLALCFLFCGEASVNVVDDKEKDKGGGGDGGAKTYKTAQATYTSGGTKYIHDLIPSGSTITEIEIYALGGSGGGQGGGYNSNLILTSHIGTGGGGGGGAAAYVKLGNLGLKAGESVSFSVSIGSGGSGGDYWDGYFDESGSPGSSGGSTTVSWSSKSITLSAAGGSGGGGSSKTVPGGSGGAEWNCSVPTSSPYYVGSWTASGSSGSNGDFDKSVTAYGGDAARITYGSLSSFGAWKSGGSGGYAKSNGSRGDGGEVAVVVKYY